MSTPGKIDDQPAYILHSRAYRETSELLEVFTAQYGRIGLVARGVRRPKSRLRGLLNPFQALQVSWSGRGELGTLRAAENAGESCQLNADQVMAGFYVNELLLRLLHRHDAHPALFMHYASLIAQLSAGGPIEPLLRGFEVELLREIGYALNLERDAINSEPLQQTQLYEFHIAQGAIPVEQKSEDYLCFTGAELLSIGRLDFGSPERQKQAKRLLRAALNYHLGETNLQTRKVAAAMKR